MRSSQVCWLVVILSLLSFCATPWFGPTAVTLEDLWSANANGEIFWSLRLTRVTAAFICGGALSICGLTYQGVLRNALATPFTLGIAGGSALGVVIALLVIPEIFGVRVLGAGCGALLSILTISGLAKVFGGGSSYALILSGIVLSFFSANAIFLLQIASDIGNIVFIARWMTGAIASPSWGEVGWLALVVLVGSLLVQLQASTLTLLSLGEDFARAKSKDVDYGITMIVCGTSVLVAAVIALAGPIGFVGLLEPYVVRRLVGINYRIGIGLAFLLGGIVLTWCDTLARCILAPVELPVGVVTGIVGAPCFFWILARTMRRVK